MNTKSLSDFFPKLTPEQWAERERQNAEDEKRKLFQVVYQRVSTSGIPKAYRNTKADMPEIVSWCENPSIGLLLQGKQGRGKTYQACGALILLARTGTIKFATFGDVIRDYESTRELRMSTRSVTNEYTAPFALVLDNLGRDSMNAYTAPKFVEIIDKRLQNGRPTILTTTLDGKHFSEWLASSGNPEIAKDVSSRMRQYKIVRFEGEDRRSA